MEKQSPLGRTLGISSEAVCSRKARRVPGTFKEAPYLGGGLLPTEGQFSRDIVLPLIRELYACQNGIETAGKYENTIFRYLLYELKKESGAQTSGLSYQIAEYISRNFDKPITLRQLALEFGYCEDYLGRVFKKQYQTSIHRYMKKEFPLPNGENKREVESSNCLIFCLFFQYKLHT